MTLPAEYVGNGMRLMDIGASLGTYDDFEEMELHSTILIDKQGRVHWARTGGDPFSDVAFLTKQLERMNQ